jgi:hypothetical protein
LLLRGLIAADRSGRYSQVRAQITLLSRGNQYAHDDEAQLDTEAASQRIEDGTLAQVMQQTMEVLRPEAVYFGPEDGFRTAFIVFDMADPSQLPAVTEPLFSHFKARVQIFPVMNQDDLRRGLSQLSH